MGNVKEDTLYLDIGNSFIKAAYKINDEEWVSDALRFSSVEELTVWISECELDFQAFVCASVVHDALELVSSKLGKERCVHLSVDQIAQESLDYETPQTLGIDRYLACLGAYSYQEQAIVVIDAGTACTVDFMDDQGVFKGGVIMPGVSALKQSLEHNAPVLPHVESKLPDLWPGKSTHASIQWGTIGVIKDSLEAQINRYENNTSNLDVYVTGGDAQLICDLIESDAYLNEKLVFRGMEKFLELFVD